MRTAVRGAAGAAIVATVAGSALVAHGGLSALRPDQIVEHVHAAGPAGWAAFAGAQIGVAALGVLPASLMAAGAGAAFGFGPGLALSAAGTMVGGWLAFALSRSVLRPWIATVLSGGPAAALDRAVAQDGWRFVCLLRVSPLMPFAATSYGLGLTGIGHRAFLGGTLASLPALAGYVAVGAFAQAGAAGAGMLHTALLGIGAVATLAMGRRVNAMLRGALGAQSPIRTSDRSIA